MAAPPAASSTRSRPPPVDDVEAALYEKRQKIYPREVHGWFATMRVSGALALLGLFYGVCWLRWDGRQLLLFDLPARKFNVFWWTFYPQDFLYLALASHPRRARPLLLHLARRASVVRLRLSRRPCTPRSSSGSRGRSRETGRGR